MDSHFYYYRPVERWSVVYINSCDREKVNMTIIRYPTRDFPTALDEHEAQFDEVNANEGELVAGLVHLDELATPAADPIEPSTPEPLSLAIVGLMLGVIAVASLAALAKFL
jgi:hypothetical protein